jgi:cytochrome c peroxidase
MIRKHSTWGFLSLVMLTAVMACRHDVEEIGFHTTPYDLAIPSGWSAFEIPENNPMTSEGVALGRKLFYDPILSGNNTQSCASCHQLQNAFSDTTAFSTGIDGNVGTRNAMPLINLGWQRKFFWDGGAADMESQVLGPVQNPIEMHEDWSHAIDELNADPGYPSLFYQAFATNEITVPLVIRAIAQFERTLISGNAKYDQYTRGEASLSTLEMQGLSVFTDPLKGDCNHCHSLGTTFSDFEFRNTGLDSIPVDGGRYLITLNESDRGKFKTPSLRNVELTAPYMHDGRFQTLMQCIDHYNSGFHYTSNLDVNLLTAQKGRMSVEDKLALEAFLKTLTDWDFIQNPAFDDPNP